MTITLNGTTGITTPALTNSGALTQTGAATLSSTLQAATTIGVGGATPSASGSGITFPATQSASSDANTLDDYEEGTFTPTQQSGLTGTVSNITGIYTKIGRMVNVQVVISGSSLAIANASTFLSGLPFSVSTGGGALSIGSCANQSNQNWRGVFFGGVYFYNIGGATSGDSSIYISGTYPSTN